MRVDISFVATAGLKASIPLGLPKKIPAEIDFHFDGEGPDSAYQISSLASQRRSLIAGWL